MHQSWEWLSLMYQSCIVFNVNPTMLDFQVWSIILNFETFSYEVPCFRYCIYQSSNMMSLPYIRRQGQVWQYLRLPPDPSSYFLHVSGIWYFMKVKNFGLDELAFWENFNDSNETSIGKIKFDWVRLNHFALILDHPTAELKCPDNHLLLL